MARCSIRYATAALVALLTLFGGVSLAAATPRPSDPHSQYGYVSPESTYVSGRLVVHYVTQGLDAPSLLDDNHDGVPDYVQELTDAGNDALAYYAQSGFLVPPPDQGGPDGRIDVYITSLHGYGCGFSDPDQNASGPYVVVSQLLDREPQGGAQCSLPQTISHELFHVVQFAYPGFAAWPAWLIEGTPSAMQELLVPNVHDAVLDDHLFQGFAHADQTLCARDPYSAYTFWLTIIDLDPTFLPYYLGRQSHAAQDPCGYQRLNQLLERHSHTSLAAVFEQTIIEHSSALSPWRELKLKRAPQRATGTITVLAAKDLLIDYPPTAKAVVVDSRSSARLVVWIGGTIVRLDPGTQHTVVTLRAGYAGQGDILVVGGLKPARYSVSVRLG
jgi:hypothetical protein